MYALSKPEFDIGFFTNRIDETLAFWREEIGLAYEEPVYFNDGLVQYRHALGNSVVKINGASDGVGENVAGGYGRLFIVKEGIENSQIKVDPNGNEIHFVKPGYKGISYLGIEMFAADSSAEKNFFLNAMGWHQELTGCFKPADNSSNCCVLLKEDLQRPFAGHWVNSGFRYFTLHVMQVDTAYQGIVDNGGLEGERPYAIGDIAKISFVRSPAGNWIEVAQRRELAGP